MFHPSYGNRPVDEVETRRHSPQHLSVRSNARVLDARNSPPHVHEQISLPSAADLFDSVEAGAASFMSAPVPESDVPLTTPKRKPKARDGRSNSSDPKRAKGSSTGEGNNERANASHSGQPKGFIPPQMTRPNIVTEDSALWSSNASIKRQRQLEAGRRGSGGGGAAAAKKGKDGGEKGGKDSMSFKQREKVRKRATGCPM